MFNVKIVLILLRIPVWIAFQHLTEFMISQLIAVNVRVIIIPFQIKKIAIVKNDAIF